MNRNPYFLPDLFFASRIKLPIGNITAHNIHEPDMISWIENVIHKGRGPLKSITGGAG